MIYTMKENKRTVMAVLVSIFIGASAICQIVRIASMNGIISYGYTPDSSAKEWAIICLSFDLVAILMISVGAHIYRRVNLNETSVSYFSLVYIGLIIGGIATGITLNSVHDDFNSYLTVADMRERGSLPSKVEEIYWWIKALSCTFIPMVLVCVLTGVMCLTYIVVDVYENGALEYYSNPMKSKLNRTASTAGANNVNDNSTESFDKSLERIRKTKLLLDEGVLAKEAFDKAATRFKSTLATWSKLYFELTTTITMGDINSISNEKVSDFEMCSKYLVQNFSWAEKNKQRIGLSHLEEIKESLSHTQVTLNVYKEKR